MLIYEAFTNGLQLESLLTRMTLFPSWYLLVLKSCHHDCLCTGFILSLLVSPSILCRHAILKTLFSDASNKPIRSMPRGVCSDRSGVLFTGELAHPLMCSWV